MPRNWNLTGLYKASRDRMPAKRSRSIGTAMAGGPRITVPRDPAEVADCIDCGAKEDSAIHYMKCIERRPL